MTPFAAVQFSSLRTNGFTETNAGMPSAIGLNYLGQSTPSVPSFVGAQIDTQINIFDQFIVGGWTRVSWKHEFNTLREINAAFLAAPGSDFTINGAQVPRDMARINTGLELGVSKNVAFFVTFNSDLAAKGYSYAGSGGMRVAW